MKPFTDSDKDSHLSPPITWCWIFVYLS
uniref:Uncharacterized protein n=1 Tax=Arundo donax TaxID=35708 RepID=A0A0A9BJP5_ARUDO